MAQVNIIKDKSVPPPIIKIGYYKQTRSGNGARYVEIGPLTIWFSYSEVIAFQIGGEPRVISRNYWGNGTGAHLNLIDRDKSKRVEADEFKARLAEVLAKIDFALTVAV